VAAAQRPRVARSLRCAWHAICDTTGMRWWLVVFVAACGTSPPPKQTVFPTLDPSETYNTRIASLRTTLARAGISLRVAGRDDAFATADCNSTEPRKTFGGCARCELAGERTAIDGAVIEAATRAFARYPTAVLAASKIEHVAVCREIVYAKPEQIDHPAGLADVHGHGLLLSVNYFLDEPTYRSGAEFTVDDIAHHEVFHLLEHELMRVEMYNDPEWDLHNPLGFEYADALRTEPRRAGFVNSYSMTAPTEDKASVYEFMMAHSDELCAMAKTDETLRIKTRIIWRRVLRAVGTDEFIRTAAPCIDWLDG
jgi:hypothetical protein